jgi:hypothetical protein
MTTLHERPTQRKRDYARAGVSITHRSDPWGIDALFDGSRGLSEVIVDVARLGARLIIQTAVGVEVNVFLGRARYQRGTARTLGSGAVVASATPRSRRRPCRSPWRDRGCAAPPRRSPAGCSARASPGRRALEGRLRTPRPRGDPSHCGGVRAPDDTHGPQRDGCIGGVPGPVTRVGPRRGHRARKRLNATPIRGSPLAFFEHRRTPTRARVGVRSWRTHD